jgi:aspartyl/asparaginyl beta-hydroxylase (cupin superfamily)
MKNLIKQRKRPWVAYDRGGYPADEAHQFDPGLFDWVPQVESQWEVVRDELKSVLTHTPALRPYPDAQMTNKRNAWKTAGLMYWTFRSPTYIKMFPRLWAILQAIPNLTSASLLKLEPNSTIKPHVGDTNAVVRCHMGLIVPAAAPRCGLRVKDTTFSWVEGRIFMFNDAHEHTAWNNTDGERYVLSFDVIRPEFVGMERWVASQVLGNIYFDVVSHRNEWFRKLFSGKFATALLRRTSKLFFRTLIFLRLPLFNLL